MKNMNNRLFYYYIPGGLFLVCMLIGVLIMRNNMSMMYSKSLVMPLVFIALPVLLIYFIGFSVTKLAIELRRGKTGSQFQVRILLSFLLVIVLIMGPFILFMNNMLNRSFDVWMMADLRNALDSGHALTQLIESENKRVLMVATEKIQQNLLQGAQPINGVEVGYFKLYQNKEPAGFLSVDKDDFNLITSKDLSEYKLSTDLFMRKQFGQRYYLVFLRQTKVGDKETIIITATKIGGELYKRMAAIEKGYLVYKQLNAFQKPYRSFIFMIMIDLVLLVLLVSAILSIMFAKQRASPILKLYEGIQNIASGRLDYTIDYQQQDEMKILITSFNNMIKELSFNQQAVQHSRHMEAWKKLSVRIIEELKKRLQDMSTEIKQATGSLDDQNPQRADFLQVQSQVQELTRLVSEFDVITTSSNLALKKENLNDIIRDVVEMFESLNSNISFFVELDNSIPLLNINREEVHQVLVNLLKNSIEAIPARGKGLIKVVTQSHKTLQGNFVRLEIADNGVGIDEDIILKIYDPYFTTKKKKQGLGLTIVKKIITEHEAKIAFKRIDGRSIFTIEFMGV
jgi:two-component system, NtrC family, nitrogen regulation sensor histidine kinase NtrY